MYSKRGLYECFPPKRVRHLKTRRNAGHSETGRSLSLSVELAEHFKQSGARRPFGPSASLTILNKSD